VYPALLVAVALQLEPNPPYEGEAATLVIATQGETAPLAVDVNGAAMLRRVPDGATVERVESDLHLRWQHPPEHARVELVLRADTAAPWLTVTALSGTNQTKLDAKQLARESPPTPGNRVFPIVTLGFALSLLMWPTFRLLWRHSRTVGLLAAIAGTIAAVYFANIWWNDLATTSHDRTGSCVITDGMLVYSGHEHAKRFYSLMFAAEVEGRPRIAGDTDTSVWTDRDSEAHTHLARFEPGKPYPCWWSTTDPNELLLEPPSRGVTRRTLATLAALLLIIAPGWLGGSGRRRR